jgi:hypothetical protein
LHTPETRLFKFVLDTDKREQRYEWPLIVKVLNVQMQDALPVLWALVYSDAPPRVYKVMRFLTGEAVYGITNHLGTVQLATGDVLHYFGGGPGL